MRFVVKHFSEVFQESFSTVKVVPRNLNNEYLPISDHSDFDVPIKNRGCSSAPVFLSTRIYYSVYRRSQAILPIYFVFLTVQSEFLKVLEFGDFSPLFIPKSGHLYSVQAVSHISRWSCLSRTDPGCVRPLSLLRCSCHRTRCKEDISADTSYTPILCV